MVKLKKGISVIIPTYKRNKLLVRCLTSILHQSKRPNEIIVVDNAGDKELKKIVYQLQKKSPVPINYVFEKKPGAGSARNRGIKEADYEILAFLDDDCIADKNWIKEIELFFKKNKAGVVMMGKNLLSNQKNLFAYYTHYLTDSYFSYYRYQIGNQLYSLALDSKNFAIKKNILVKNNIYFDELYPAAEDIDLGIQMQKLAYKIFFNPKTIVFHQEKTNFFSIIKSSFLKGMGTAKISLKWRKKIFLHLLPPKTFIKYWLKKEDFLKKTKNEFFSNLSFSQHLLFIFFKLIIDVVGIIGFYFYKATRFFNRLK